MKNLLLWLRYRNLLHGHRKWSEETASLWDQSRIGYVFLKEREIFGLLLSPISDEICSRISDEQSSRTSEEKEAQGVLEVACGTARYSELFHPEQYVGLDFSRAMLHVAKKKHPDLQFILADAFNLPFRDGAFQTVFTSRFVHHYSSLDSFFLEVARVTVTRLVFDTTCGNVLMRLAILIFRNKIHYRTASEVIAEIGGCGFESGTYIHFFVLPATLYSLIPETLAKVLDRVFASTPARAFIVAERKSW